MRAREYDPDTGRFLELDPKEEEIGEVYLSDYLYADDDPTLLTDPSGLDPNLGAGKINCKKNRDFCQIIYMVGYKDGEKTLRLRTHIEVLYNDWGISYDYILGVTQHKGKIMWLTGSGINQVSYLRYGGRKVDIKKPWQQELCGFWCSFGFLTTQIAGCDSRRSCNALVPLLFIPGGEASAGSRLLGRIPKSQKAFKFFRKGEKVAPVISAGAGGRRILTWAEESGMLRAAARGKGNFGIGKGTIEDAKALGHAWVGDGYRVASDGKTLISKDGLRHYRPPSFKKKVKRVQANLEYFVEGQKKKRPIGNAHIDIIEVK